MEDIEIQKKSNLLKISPNNKPIKYEFPEIVSYNKPELSDLKIFDNERFINDLFENLTIENLEDKEITDLKEKKYNNEEGEIEEINTLEYEFINSMLNQGDKIELNEHFNESNIGKIIMYGYYRFLNLKNYMELELNELLINFKIGDWIKVEDNLIIGLQDLKEQYETSIHNRFNYYCSIILYVQNSKTNSEVNIPVYLDKNKDFYIPTYRKIVKNYFTLLNISKKISFLEYNINTGIYSLFFGERFNIMKYDIINNKIKYSEFPSYYNEESIEELINSEKKL